MSTSAYMVRLDWYDATRPYLVVATFRSFNQGMGRYESLKQANRRAYNLNRAHKFNNEKSGAAK